MVLSLVPAIATPASADFPLRRGNTSIAAQIATERGCQEDGAEPVYVVGDPIEGLDDVDSDELKVFHAGTATRDGHPVTAGGRVLCATALGATVRDARSRAYQAVERIHWADRYFRTDIGARAIAREGD